VADLNDPQEAVAWLRSPAAIRERCNRVLAAAEAGELAHFALVPERLEDAAAYTTSPSAGATAGPNWPPASARRTVRKSRAFVSTWP
jgi:hypothetical protein